MLIALSQQSSPLADCLLLQKDVPALLLVNAVHKLEQIRVQIQLIIADREGFNKPVNVVLAVVPLDLRNESQQVLHVVMAIVVNVVLVHDFHRRDEDVKSALKQVAQYFVEGKDFAANSKGYVRKLLLAEADEQVYFHVVVEVQPLIRLVVLELLVDDDRVENVQVDFLKAVQVRFDVIAEYVRDVDGVPHQRRAAGFVLFSVAVVCVLQFDVWFLV